MNEFDYLIDGVFKPHIYAKMVKTYQKNDDPTGWFGNFDLVYECNTIQILPDGYRKKVRESISSLVSNEGYLLVSCRSRNEGELENAIPFPLSRSEMNEFINIDKLKEISFLAYDDTQKPSVPQFFAIYVKV
jgi:hypothetical protein